MAHHLTDSLVRNLTPPDHGNRIVYDDTDGLPGFGIRVTAAGNRSFILNYRVKGSGRERRYTIGSAASWTAAAARKEAKRLRVVIDGGGDPQGDIDTDRTAPTMADLIQRFEEEQLPRKRPGTARFYQLLLHNHIKPHFGQHTKVADVKFADCDDLHRKITKAGSPYAANRTKAVLSVMFKLAEKWEWRVGGTNPATHIESNVEESRKRYLSSDELKRLLDALAGHPNQQIANIFRVCLLTGCRRGEARSMRWADLDLDRRDDEGNPKPIWTKPASSTKQKTDHVTPVPAPLQMMLTTIWNAQRGARSEWVFPSSRGDGHIIELQLDWVKLCKAAKITGLRNHDLRHQYASQLVSGGASLPLIGALLGHSNPKTTARYAHLFVDPLRAAAEKVAAIHSGAPAAEVKPLTKGRRRK
jgi:integrase